MFFFFFSSRRRHTRLQGDWSSDVCSSDLTARNDSSVAGDPPRRDVGHARSTRTGYTALHALSGGTGTACRRTSFFLPRDRDAPRHLSPDHRNSHSAVHARLLSGRSFGEARLALPTG